MPKTLSLVFFAAVAAVCGPSIASAQDKADPSDAIIVTARHREEALQRTPVSVVAIGPAELDARTIRNLSDVQRLVPNLTLAPAQNMGDAAANLFIRGIGQEDFAAGTEPGVGLYIDGVYIGRSAGSLIELVDIARVEVLRGPQGTLYGRNTIGGAINVISAVPTDEPTGAAELFIGNFDRLESRGIINLPLSDRVAARLSLSAVRRDGYLRRLAPPFAPTFYTETDDRAEGADNRIGGRLQLRIRASETVRVDLAADATRRRGTQSPTHLDAINPARRNLRFVNSLISSGVLPGPPIDIGLVTANLRESRAGGGNRIAQESGGVLATLTRTAGPHEISLTGAWRGSRSFVSTDLDGTYFSLFSSQFDERQEQFSGELRANGAVGGFTYTAGLFALREMAEVRPTRGGQDVLYFCRCFYAPDNLPVTRFPARGTSSTSYAAYAQATLGLAAGLSATLGARYSLDRKLIRGRMVLLDPATLDPTGQVLATGANRGRWGSLTWRAGLEFQADARTMLYASAAKGFKSGGFNVRPDPNAPNLGLDRFAPETATTFEAGLRSEWLDERLRLNATVFHTAYRDIQLRQQFFSEGLFMTRIDNAARARVRGIEVEIAARPLRDLNLAFSYGHLDPRYLDISMVPGLTLASAFQRTPRHSFSLSLDYARPLLEGRLSVHADYGYRSREQFQLVATPWDQPGYGLLNARLGWSAPEDRWSVAVFGSNLADKKYRTAGRGTILNEAGLAYSHIGRPRQIGLEFKAGL